MKTLVIIRHAKSSWQNQQLTDFDRPLNPRGERDAPFMGRQLLQQSINFGAMLSSPAIRAITTARIIAGENGFPAEDIREIEQLYLADLPVLLKITRQLPDEVEAAIICGHNPGLTAYATYLSGHYIDNVPTCGMVCLDLGIEVWREADEYAGKLRFFDYPRRHFP